MFYRDGTDVPQDKAEAMRWFRKASDQGNADAQYFLGWMYHIGDGMPPDEADAVRWWRKSAKRGNETAKSMLVVRGIE
jgi:TPR repeat protein